LLAVSDAGQTIFNPQYEVAALSKVRQTQIINGHQAKTTTKRYIETPFKGRFA
jgi:hypothetical protein